MKYDDEAASGPWHLLAPLSCVHMSAGSHMSALPLQPIFPPPGLGCCVVNVMLSSTLCRAQIDPTTFFSAAFHSSWYRL